MAEADGVCELPKKVSLFADDNEGLNVPNPTVRQSLNMEEFLKTEYDHCSLCDGFYSLNYGQPVCSSCHLFLFPEDINNPDDISYLEKADSDDSGNEEPEDAAAFYELDETQRRRTRKVKTSTKKADKLAERINALTIPRDYDKERSTDGLIESFPTEVLLSVFRYLDDISKWAARNVCSRWQQILDDVTTQEQWRHFIRLRWPLFEPQYKVMCWKTIYAKLVESAPCLFCLNNMMLQSTPPIEEDSWRHRRLRSELKTLQTDPPEGIQATPLDKYCCHWQASVTGPAGSPFEGGIFYLYLQIPHSYPMRPPVVHFITRIFHPNIGRHGDIGLDSIHHNWSLALTISKVLVSIQSLLTDPYCYVCMEPKIGRLYENNRKEFDRIARIWTWKYAMHDYLMPIDIKLDAL